MYFLFINAILNVKVAKKLHQDKQFLVPYAQRVLDAYRKTCGEFSVKRGESLEGVVQVSHCGTKGSERQVNYLLKQCTCGQWEDKICIHGYVVAVAFGLLRLDYKHFIEHGFYSCYWAVTYFTYLTDECVLLLPD
jgi:hypothetical protein